MSEKEKEKQIDLNVVPDNPEAAVFASTQNPDALIQSVDTSTAGELVGQTIGNHYQILEQLGQGGLGTVYKAQHELLGTFCAIKFLLSTKQFDGKALQRFRREAEAAVKLRHPYIAGVQEFGIHNGAPFIVMEYVDGTALDEIIKEEGTLEPHLALQIIKQAAEALSYAHKQRVIHRDIKPANIMLCKDKSGNEEVKIIDFGIAKVLDEDEARDLTQTGEVFGTPKYMSPEQCQGKKADSRSDLYSLGCVAYEMLSGFPPFSADSAIELIMKHVTDPPSQLKSISKLKGIQNVIARLLAKDPKHRHESAEALLLDLQLIERGVKPMRFVDPTSSKRRINRLFFVSLVIAAFAFAAFIFASVIERTLFFQTKLIEFNPNNHAAYARRAEMHFGNQTYSEAIVDLNKAIELDPTNPYRYVLRAEAYWNLKDADRALKDCAKTIELAPHWYNPYLLRAEIYSQTNKPGDVIRDAGIAIERMREVNQSWDTTHAYILRAAAENSLNQFKNALNDAETALQLQARLSEPQRAKEKWVSEAALARATALTNLGRTKEAIETLNRPIASYPLSHVLISARAKAKFASSDRKGALEDIQTALSLSKDNNAYQEFRNTILNSTK